MAPAELSFIVEGVLSILGVHTSKPRQLGIAQKSL